MIIRNNRLSRLAYNSNRKTTASIQKNLEKLSSGYQINRAADDVAGLSVSERIRAKVTELGRCQINAEEGIDLARTADAALQEINDMFKRARYLCIEAANGTYSEQELSEINDEMNHLFDEIDRISAGTYHNTICLFRGDTSEGKRSHFEYDETFTVPDSGELTLWGEMSFVETKPFERATEAKAATATLNLDDSIDFNDVNSLNGKAITISSSYNSSGKYTFYFTDGTIPAPDTPSVEINITDYKTTESALNALCSYLRGYRAPEIDSAVLDKTARTITLKAPMKDLNMGSLDVDVVEGGIPNNAVDGDGAWANGLSIASTPAGSAALGQVDGQGAANNKPVYSDTATARLSLSRLHSPLTQTDVTNLAGNSLSILGKTIKLSDLNATVGMSRDDVGTKLAALIQSNVSNCKAVYDSSGPAIDITLTNQPTDRGSTDLIIENTVRPQTHEETKNLWTSEALNFGISVTTTATGERPEVCEITVPDDLSRPFSFSINSTKYLYYDETKNPLKEPGATGTKYNDSYSTPNLVKIQGMSQEQIIQDIANKIRSASGGTVAINGNKITVTAGSLGNSMNLGNKISGTTIRVTSYKDVTDKEGTSLALGNYSTTYVHKTATIPFSLGSTLDVDQLAGKGFRISYTNEGRAISKKVEFTKGAGISDDYTEDVDLSGCTTFEELKERVSKVLGSDCTVEIDSSEPNDVKLLISVKAHVDQWTKEDVFVVDGREGASGLLSTKDTIKYSGGQKTDFSHATIDFSSINADNLDTLLGKGFRIDCSTCSGEYINVYFCWENDGNAPKSFKVTDPVTGDERTIHNIPVELSKVSDGSRIVQSIVEQVSPELKHFTDVKVGDPPTTLIAMEKRIGDVLVNGTLQLGKIESGVYTNFTYSVSKEEVEDPPEDELGTSELQLESSKVKIYVGADPEPQFIPIHLPYLDLETLNLKPPELVDLNDPEQSPSDWLSRVDAADLAISSSRGTIGADYNRLEHALRELSNTHIQLSDAYSVIRDADMAQLMMSQVKDQILMQAQQAMLSQANQVPQGVLQLLQ